jgi:hypothetical protein
MSKRSQAYRFTSFLIEEPTFNSNIVQYLVYGQEICPTTNKKHWQGYVKFFNVTTTTAAQSAIKIGKSHMEACKGVVEENFDFCTKDGAYKEFGKKPVGQGRRTDLKDPLFKYYSNKKNEVIKAAEDKKISMSKEIYEQGMFEYKSIDEQRKIRLVDLEKSKADLNEYKMTLDRERNEYKKSADRELDEYRKQINDEKLRLREELDKYKNQINDEKTLEKTPEKELTELD